MTKLQEGDTVLCTVKKIVGTTVFVDIEEDGEATIIISEIAPGRIRNLRKYVSPGRKIVCKILKIKDDQKYLSLRRVTTKEKKEVLEKHQREKKYIATLKTLFPEKGEKISEEIKGKENISDFFEKVKTSPELLEKYLNKEETERLLKILKQKKEKQVEIKIRFNLHGQQSDGINKIKLILNIKQNSAKITYIAAGKYSLKIKSENYKEANKIADDILENIEKQAKQEKMFFEKEKSRK